MEVTSFQNRADWCHLMALPCLKGGTECGNNWVKTPIYSAPAIKGLKVKEAQFNFQWCLLWVHQFTHQNISDPWVDVQPFWGRKLASGSAVSILSGSVPSMTAYYPLAVQCQQLLIRSSWSHAYTVDRCKIIIFLIAFTVRLPIFSWSYT